MKKMRLAGIAAVVAEGPLIGGVGLTSLAFPGGGSWNDKISSHDEAY